MSARPGLGPVAMIGAGRLARALLPALRRAGYAVAVVAAPRPARARSAARLTPGARGTSDLARAAAAGRVLLLAVPDAALAPLAATLAGLPGVRWEGRIVLHHAGALGPEVLRPLSRAGAKVGVLHPLQSLSGPAGASALAGSRARIEGHREAARAARRIARDLGLVPLRLDRAPTAARREAYHAAAALASNDVVALLSAALDLFARSGVRRADALPALLALTRGTLSRIEAEGIRGALTGPAARGDRATLRRHLARLAAAAPDTAEAHRLLSLRLARLAGPRARRALGTLGRPRGGRRGGAKV